MTISNTMERPAAQGPDRTDRNMRDPNKRMLRDAMTKALKIADEYLADVIKNIGEDQQPKVIYIGLMDAANSDGLFPCDGYAPECLRMDAIRAIDRHCGEGYASEHLDLYGLFRRITGSLWAEAFFEMQREEMISRVVKNLTSGKFLEVIAAKLTSRNDH